MLEAYAGSTYRSQLQSAIEQLAERIPEQAWVDLQQLAVIVGGHHGFFPGSVALFSVSVVG